MDAGRGLAQLPSQTGGRRVVGTGRRHCFLGRQQGERLGWPDGGTGRGRPGCTEDISRGSPLKWGATSDLEIAALWRSKRAVVASDTVANFRQPNNCVVRDSGDGQMHRHQHSDGSGWLMRDRSTYCVATYCVATLYVVILVGMQTRPGVTGHGTWPSQRRSNDPPTLILMSLADGAKHGHALLKDIEEFAGVKLGPGALYGAITRMAERGLIEPLESDDRRRPYQITASGSQTLADSVAQMRELVRVGQARLKMPRTTRPRLA
jgi:DNA-binding PadR family transcriptional regulator